MLNPWFWAKNHAYSWCIQQGKLDERWRGTIISLQLMENKFSSVESPESLLNQQGMLLLIVLFPRLRALRQIQTQLLLSAPVLSEHRAGQCRPRRSLQCGSPPPRLVPLLWGTPSVPSAHSRHAHWGHWLRHRQLLRADKHWSLTVKRTCCRFIYKGLKLIHLVLRGNDTHKNSPTDQQNILYCVAGWIMTSGPSHHPKDAHIFIPGTCGCCDKNGLYRCDSVKTLRRGIYLGLSNWALIIPCVSLSEGGRGDLKQIEEEVAR